MYFSQYNEIQEQAQGVYDAFLWTSWRRIRYESPEGQGVKTFKHILCFTSTKKSGAFPRDSCHETTLSLWQAGDLGFGRWPSLKRFLPLWDSVLGTVTKLTIWSQGCLYQVSTIWLGSFHSGLERAQDVSMRSYGDSERWAGKTLLLSGQGISAHCSGKSQPYP